MFSGAFEKKEQAKSLIQLQHYWLFREEKSHLKELAFPFNVETRQIFTLLTNNFIHLKNVAKLE